MVLDYVPGMQSWCPRLFFIISQRIVVASLHFVHTSCPSICFQRTNSRLDNSSSESIPLVYGVIDWGGSRGEW